MFQTAAAAQAGGASGRKGQAIQVLYVEIYNLIDQSQISLKQQSTTIEHLLAKVKILHAAVEWYASAPRDEDGATMPLDMGERARAALKEVGSGVEEAHDQDQV